MHAGLTTNGRKPRIAHGVAAHPGLPRLRLVSPGVRAAPLIQSTIEPRPVHLDLKKDRGLTVAWDDGTSSFYSIAYLRKMSPSADNRTLKEQLAKNPLTVLPANIAKQTGLITAVDAEFVGNYALKIKFSDGHDTGLYSWKYLREIDPAPRPPSAKRQAGNE